jgi:hypothetical protein
VERPPNPKEVRVKFSPFDFDVVSGPPEPREAPKEPARPAVGARKPVEQAPPAGTEEPASAK